MRWNRIVIKLGTTMMLLFLMILLPLGYVVNQIISSYVQTIGQGNESVETVSKLILLSGVGAVFLALGFTYVVSRRLSAPLLQMEVATRKIAKGDLKTRVDVTSMDEIGSLAVAINDLAVELKRYRDSRNEFFANISHELRTPVTYIEGYTTVLREGLYVSEEERIRSLDILQRESLRLKHLIDDLFELSKMTEGKFTLQFEWIDIGDLVERCMKKMRIKMNDKGLICSWDLTDDLPLLYADGLRMEQVLLNLLENAIRYTDQGSINIRACQVEENLISIEISDTGRGIPESELPYLFDRFYRVEKSRSRELGGSGLGLAIVKELIELHHGSVHVTSLIGHGTTFNVVIPVAHGQEEEKKDDAD